MFVCADAVVVRRERALPARSSSRSRSLAPGPILYARGYCGGKRRKLVVYIYTIRGLRVFLGGARMRHFWQELLQFCCFFAFLCCSVIHTTMLFFCLYARGILAS